MTAQLRNLHDRAAQILMALRHLENTAKMLVWDLQMAMEAEDGPREEQEQKEGE